MVSSPQPVEQRMKGHVLSALAAPPRDEPGCTEPEQVGLPNDPPMCGRTQRTWPDAREPQGAAGSTLERLLPSGHSGSARVPARCTIIVRCLQLILREASSDPDMQDGLKQRTI
jgi:hypothetical protein